MSEYKPITGELRNSMTYDITTAPNGVSTASIDISAFCDMCDSIDSVHAALEAECERLRDSDGWIELPKDADGEYICAGDKLDGYGKTIEVVELRYGRSGWVLISRDGNAYADTFAFTHHHAPTVEDVLREFANEVYADADNEIRDRDFLCAKYAKRLTLVGDSE